MNDVRYLKMDINGVTIFYREAGARGAPGVLLLHGYPTSSHMFRTLIPELARRYRVIAPDLPGFGHSAMPGRDRFSYSFSNLSRLIGRFTESVGLDVFAMYVFDYGAPIGFRMALDHPERIAALISQNGNVYTEGLSAGWDAMKTFWAMPNAAEREAMRSAFAMDSVRYQYEAGVIDKRMIGPDGAALDAYFLARPGAHDVQLDLFQDYGSNVALYPAFQAYLREHRPPLLAVWGSNDPYFVPAGAQAFKRDLPDAEIHLLDTGHFALDTHLGEISRLTLDFLGRRYRESAGKHRCPLHWTRTSPWQATR